CLPARPAGVGRGRLGRGPRSAPARAGLTCAGLLVLTCAGLLVLTGADRGARPGPAAGALPGLRGIPGPGRLVAVTAGPRPALRQAGAGAALAAAAAVPATVAVRAVTARAGGL